MRNPLDENNKAEVREYYLKGGSLTIKLTNGGNIELQSENATRPQSGMIWLFEAKGANKLIQSVDPVLPKPSAVNASFWTQHHLTFDMVRKALEICEETYCGDDEGNPLTAEVWSSRSPDTRFLLGSTRCVISPFGGDTFFIGFRGTASRMDAMDNSEFNLVHLDGEGGDVTVHSGFNKRAANIIKQKLIDHIPKNPLPKKIVLTGHSLGAAISQLVYKQLREEIMKERKISAEDFKCEVLNVTFATPMVGNLKLRESLGENNLSQNMYHFVLDEDIVPAVLFYKHAYERIPKPEIISDKKTILKKILKKTIDISMNDLPQEAQDIDKLPMYEQPVYDDHPEDAMEPYAPMGNYFYLKSSGGTTRLHHFKCGDDTQNVAQALASALNILRQIGSLERFVLSSLARRAVNQMHSLAIKITEGHKLINYKNKLEKDLVQDEA